MDYPKIDKLKIVFYPDPVLKQTCAEVTRFDAGLKALVEKMVTLMKEANGVGLAAPQVGIPIRMFVCNPTGEEDDLLICVNPRFVDLQGAAEDEEGCLSLPGINVTMRRATDATMLIQDATGKALELKGSGLAARIWQHEADHLDGKLIIDNMSTSDEITNRRAIKQLKTDYIKLGAKPG
ncbi:MAG: peptide deformylase [Phycisphaerae bacterium]